MNKFLDDIKNNLKPQRANRTAVSARLQSLIQQNNLYYEEIKKHENAVRAYKQSLLTNQLKEDADRKIFGLFHQEGGVLFFAGILRQYTREVMNDETTLEQMWIGGYNSAIAHMQYKLAQMIDCYTKCGQDLEEAANAYTEKTDLLQAIGHQRSVPVVKALQEMLTDRRLSAETFNEEVPPLLEELTRITEKNKQAAKNARILGRSQVDQYQMKHLHLLKATNEVLSDERAARLSTHEGWEREAYAETLKEFESFVAQHLTEPFALPDADAE